METAYRRYIKAMDAASKLATDEFEKLWARLNVDDARQSRNILIEMLPALIEKYAAMAATATAEYYEDSRAEVIPETFEALLPDELINEEQIESSIRFAVRHLFGEDEHGKESKPSRGQELLDGQN